MNNILIWILWSAVVLVLFGLAVLLITGGLIRKDNKWMLWSGGIILDVLLGIVAFAAASIFWGPPGQFKPAVWIGLSLFWAALVFTPLFILLVPYWKGRPKGPKKDWNIQGKLTAVIVGLGFAGFFAMVIYMLGHFTNVPVEDIFRKSWLFLAIIFVCGVCVYAFRATKLIWMLLTPVAIMCGVAAMIETGRTSYNLGETKHKAEMSVYGSVTGPCVVWYETPDPRTGFPRYDYQNGEILSYSKDYMSFVVNFHYNGPDGLWHYETRYYTWERTKYPRGRWSQAKGPMAEGAWQLRLVGDGITRNGRSYLAGDYTMQFWNACTKCWQDGGKSMFEIHFPPERNVFIPY